MKCTGIYRTTKYGWPYTLICDLSPSHDGLCWDRDNNLHFEPDRAD